MDLRKDVVPLSAERANGASKVVRNSNAKFRDEDPGEPGQESEGYKCVSCRTEFPAWLGRCPNCKAWSSIKKLSEIADDDEDSDYEDDGGAKPINEIHTKHIDRRLTGISEFDRVLGGGAVPGCVTLVGGDPGVGKSTLLLQALASLSQLGARTLYVTAEESAEQVALRAQRIDDVVPEELFLMAETRTERILSEIQRIDPDVMVIDSVQTIHTSEGSAGNVTQLREVTSLMCAIAKDQKIATFLVGHITKDGSLAGPKVLEHLVDTVLLFEGERGQAFRTLRTQKNRYGSSTEVGIFTMTANGMEEVPNASEFFLAERNTQACGSIIAATNESESNRSMLVEVQAMVGNVKIGGGGRIVANGIDSSRLTLIIGILEKLLDGSMLGVRDIFVSVAGGLKITEPALDLPIAIAIVSSLAKQIVPERLVAFGEIGLTGEIRGVPRVQARLSEATSMGFHAAIVPFSVSGEAPGAIPITKKKKAAAKQGLDILPARSLEEALVHALGTLPHKSAKSKSTRRGK